MKLTFDIECTPQEARQFLGLPDVTDMQQRLLAELEARLRANIQAMEPEALMKQWMPLGLEGMDQIQRFWADLARGGRDKPKQG